MATPQYEKNLGGQPPKYKSNEELSAKVEEYFIYCDNRIEHVYSPKAEAVIEVINPAPYTMSGLARACNMSRQDILNYSRKEEFFDTIRQARERVHEDVETRLMEKQATGAIFNLTNNFGWKDMRNIDHTSDGKKIDFNVRLTDDNFTLNSEPTNEGQPPV